MKTTLVRGLLFVLFLLVFVFLVKKVDWPLAAVYAFFVTWIISPAVIEQLKK